MAYALEEKALEQPHKLTLDERKRLMMTGVTDVESFDEEMVVLHTVKGTVVVRGTGLHLQMFSPEGGQIHVDGQVDSLIYEDRVPGGSSFFSRLFG